MIVALLYGANSEGKQDEYARVEDVGADLRFSGDEHQFKHVVETYRGFAAADLGHEPTSRELLVYLSTETPLARAGRIREIKE